eukprot:10856255-Alexandrium_andersonii.AAC.1
MGCVSVSADPSGRLRPPHRSGLDNQVVPRGSIHAVVDQASLKRAAAIVPRSVAGEGSIDPDVTPVEDSVTPDLGPGQSPRG